MHYLILNPRFLPAMANDWNFLAPYFLRPMEAVNFYNDNDKQICAWLEELQASNLIPKGTIDGRDIRELRAKDLAGFEQHHFFCGVGEQVEAAIGLGWLDGICTDLEAAGYTVGAVVLPACGVEAPHRRYRIFWVANRISSRQERTRKRPPGEWRKECGPSNHSEAVCLSQSDRSGSKPWQSTSERNRHGHSTEPASGELEHAESRLERHAGHGNDRHEPGWLDARSDRPIATAGGWSDYELCHFIDGKIRRIGSRFKWMANGLPDTVVPLRNQSVEESEEKINGKTKITGSGELLSSMSERFIQEAVSEWGHRSDLKFPQKEVLQSNLHGPVDGGKNQSVKHQEQPSSISKERSEGVPTVRTNANTTLCSPYGRESYEQQSIELKNLVRLVSQAVPLAVLERDSETCEKMFSLFPSCWKARPVPGSLSTYAEEWRPPPMEEVERAWKADYFKDFRTWPRSPLKVEQEARSWRLKGYGNSIVPALAAEFIKAFMSL